jgi:hypothetical protein
MNQPAFPTAQYAFPIDSDIDINRDQPWCGMTLRDYFAAKAMQTMAKGRGAANLEQGGYVAVSMMAYKMADAMMEAREA